MVNHRVLKVKISQISSPLELGLIPFINDADTISKTMAKFVLASALPSRRVYDTTCGPTWDWYTYNKSDV